MGYAPPETDEEIAALQKKLEGAENKKKESSIKRLQQEIAKEEKDKAKNFHVLSSDHKGVVA